MILYATFITDQTSVLSQLSGCGLSHRFARVPLARWLLGRDGFQESSRDGKAFKKERMLPSGERLHFANWKDPPCY